MENGTDMSATEKSLADTAHSRQSPRGGLLALIDTRGARGVVGLTVLAVMWEIAGRMSSGLFFAPFSEVVVAAARMYTSGFIFPHLLYTLGNFTLGLVLGIAAAVPLGLVLGWKRRWLEYADPIISIMLATPVIVLVPLVIAVFGIFWESKVAITFWSVFAPVLVSMIAGVQSVDNNLVRVARSFRASDYKIIRSVVLPGSVPTLVSGLRLGMARGLIGVLAAEFFGAPRGLGYLAFSYGSTFQPAPMLVAILTMAVLGILLTAAMHHLQNKADAWRLDER